MTKTAKRGAGIFIVDNTGRCNAPSVSSMFGDAILDAILAGGTLPEELADLVTLKPVDVDGSTRWIVDFA